MHNLHTILMKILDYNKYLLLILLQIMDRTYLNEVPRLQLTPPKFEAPG